MSCANRQVTRCNFGGPDSRLRRSTEVTSRLLRSLHGRAPAALDGVGRYAASTDSRLRRSAEVTSRPLRGLRGRPTLPLRRPRMATLSTGGVGSRWFFVWLRRAQAKRARVFRARNARVPGGRGSGRLLTAPSYARARPWARRQPRRSPSAPLPRGRGCGNGTSTGRGARRT